MSRAVCQGCVGLAATKVSLERMKHLVLDAQAGMKAAAATNDGLKIRLDSWEADVRTQLLREQRTIEALRREIRDLKKALRAARRAK